MQRISIREIRNHPWFLKNLPRELTEAVQAKYYKKDNSAPIFSDQTVEQIMKIVEDARTPPPSSTPVAGFGWAEEEDQEDGKRPDEEQNDDDEEYDVEDEYDKQVKQVHASGEFQISWRDQVTSKRRFGYMPYNVYICGSYGGDVYFLVL